MAAPLFEIAEKVYLKESASAGFLEALIVDSVQKRTTEWVYTVTFARKLPTSALFGDRVTHHNPGLVYYNESELIAYCDALELVEENLTSRLAEIQRLRASASC